LEVLSLEYLCVLSITNAEEDQGTEVVSSKYTQLIPAELPPQGRARRPWLNPTDYVDIHRPEIELRNLGLRNEAEMA
jgi:hypothetical protein